MASTAALSGTSLPHPCRFMAHVRLSTPPEIILSDIDLLDLIRAVDALPENPDDVPPICYTRSRSKVLGLVGTPPVKTPSPSLSNNKRALSESHTNPPVPKRAKATGVGVPTPPMGSTIPVQPKGKGKVAYQRELRRSQRLQTGSKIKKVALKRAHAAATLPSGISRNNPASIRVSSTAWTGVRCKPAHKPEAREYSLTELLGDLAFDLIHWDGRDPILFLDKEGRVIIVLAGQPRAGWNTVVDDAAEIIEDARPRCNFPDEVHRRGDFATLATGISFGGGQKRPGILKNKQEHHEILRDIFSTKPFIRISGFVNSVFRTYAPAVREAYEKNIQELLTSDESLERNFSNSAFAAATINFGPRTICHPHTDFGNVSWGWCGITALGDFNPDLGGHLVLWDLKRVIRFPPGSTILLPSALFMHSNISIRKDEKRYSVTQYSAGGLFRWVYNGFKTNADFMAVHEDDIKKMRQREEDRENRWEDALKMFKVWKS